MADYQYLEDSGVVVADTAEILTDVQDEYKSAFGSDLVVDPSTPQGVLITAETLARKAVVNNNAALANQINPNLAGGVFLDAIAALTGLQRVAATRSTVAATLTGVADAVIPAGSRAGTVAGIEFETVGTVVMSAGGTASADMQAVDFGPIALAPGDLTEIVTGVLGWETVTNADAAVLGTDEESDAAFRTRRRLTLALQGVSLPEAITSALYDVPNVKSLAFRENVAATSETIDGILMAAHSIYACVDGGLDSDVASALLFNKSLGAGYNGTTTVNVTEPASGQVYPVKFQRPADIEVEIRVTVKQGSYVGNLTTGIPAAVVDWSTGASGEAPGFGVGNPVSCFELAGVVSAAFPGVFVQNVETQVVGAGPYSNAEIPVGIDEVARTTQNYVSVVIV
jgi:hypothetical protein